LSEQYIIVIDYITAIEKLINFSYE